MIITVSIGSYIVGSNWRVIFPPGGLTVKEKQKIETFKDSLNQKVTIRENDWTPFLSVPLKDTLSIIKVTYQEKYDSEKEVFCMAIFENRITGEYKCIASWLSNYVLQKSNLVTLNPKVVSKKEMKNE